MPTPVWHRPNQSSSSESGRRRRCVIGRPFEELLKGTVNRYFRRNRFRECCKAPLRRGSGDRAPADERVAEAYQRGGGTRRVMQPARTHAVRNAPARLVVTVAVVQTYLRPCGQGDVPGPADPRHLHLSALAISRYTASVSPSFSVPSPLEKK